VYALTSNCHFVHCHQLKNRKILISSLAPDIAFADVNTGRNAILSSEIELKEEVGRGGFATVYKALYNGE
jgi:hypothetical protein